MKAGQYRTHEINEITKNIIIIDNRPCTKYAHAQSENECGREDAKVVVPE